MSGSQLVVSSNGRKVEHLLINIFLWYLAEQRRIVSFNLQNLPFISQSLSLDPRSPSGIPRTPIVVEEENSAKTEEQPKRGAVAAKIPATKLEFEENTELDKATSVQDEEIQILAKENGSEDEEKEEKNILTPEDDVIVIEDDDASDEMREHEEKESKKVENLDDKSEVEALAEKSLESTLEEGEIRYDRMTA